MIYLGPFLFAYLPAILLNGTTTEIVMTYITCFLGTITFSSLTMGYFLCPTNIVEWLVAAAGTVLLLFPMVLQALTPWHLPDLLIDFIAIGFFLAVYFSQKMRIKRDPTLILPLAERMALKGKQCLKPLQPVLPQATERIFSGSLRQNRSERMSIHGRVLSRPCFIRIAAGEKVRLRSVTLISGC